MDVDCRLEDVTYVYEDTPTYRLLYEIQNTPLMPYSLESCNANMICKYWVPNKDGEYKQQVCKKNV
jgi:hypothetical protein